MHHATDEPQSINTNRPSSTRAELMLVLSTLVWGASFAPAREAGEISNAAFGATAIVIGPVVSLGLRFLLAAVIWFILAWAVRGVRERFFGSSIRRIDRMTKQQVSQSASPCEKSDQKFPTLSIRRATILSSGVGVLLAIGIMVQHISLDLLPGDRAESVAAFLTSLTVITVPLTLWLIWRDRPTSSLGLAIALAVSGVWLMTRPPAETIHTSDNSVGIMGVVFGIICAIVFAFHIIAVNALAPRVSMSRLNGVQFIVVGIISLIVALIMMAVTNQWPTWPIANLNRWLLDIIFLTLGPTILSYTLMVIYQPQVSPVRAAIIYMLEPVFATGFAWLWADKELERIAIAGPGLILLANVVAEIGPRIGRKNFSQS